MGKMLKTMPCGPNQAEETEFTVTYPLSAYQLRSAASGFKIQSCKY